MSSVFSFKFSKVSYLLKFIYLYSAYTAVSLFVVLFFFLRPRNPKNAVIVAKIMKYVHKLVRSHFFMMTVKIPLIFVTGPDTVYNRGS